MAFNNDLVKSNNKIAYGLPSIVIWDADVKPRQRREGFENEFAAGFQVVLFRDGGSEILNWTFVRCRVRVRKSLRQGMSSFWNTRARRHTLEYTRSRARYRPIM